MSDNLRSKRILILTANPHGTPYLDLEKEVNKIHRELQLAAESSLFETKIVRYATLEELFRSINQYRPNILHFAGHGRKELNGETETRSDRSRKFVVAQEEGLVFENEKGEPKIISGENLSELFQHFSDTLECVILNACYSEKQAKVIEKHINYVIGMKREILDQAAIEFSKGFYCALGAGRSCEFSFRMGCVAIKLAGVTGNLIPQLQGKKKQALECQRQKEALTLTESQIRDFRDALAIAYSREEDLARIVDHKFKDLRYEYIRIVGYNDNYPQKIEILIKDFRGRGDLLLFIEEVCEDRPRNLQLQNFYQSILPNPSKDPQLQLNKYFTEIQNSFQEGQLIFFLGSGINNYPDSENQQIPPNDIEIARHLANNIDFEAIVDVPCQICPSKLDQRPQKNNDALCPVWKKIQTDNNTGSQEHLKYEQDLAFAKLEMRCWSQYKINDVSYEGLKSNLQKLFRNEYAHPYNYNKIQKKIVDLSQKISKNQILIFTTSYDTGLEKAFIKNELEFYVIYYYLNSSSMVGTFRYKYFGKSNDDRDQKAKIKEPEIQEIKQVSLLPVKTNTKNNRKHLTKPIIFKLYGGVLYDTDKGYDSFAIAESHLLNYPQKVLDTFPDNLISYLQSGNILFLGCNPNDVELLALLYRVFPEKFDTDSRCLASSEKGWLVTQVDPGKIHNNNEWKDLGIITFKSSPEEFLNKFENFLEKNQKQQND